MAMIYIVEDDKNIQEIEAYALKGNGYEVKCFDDAASFDEGMKEMTEKAQSRYTYQTASYYSCYCKINRNRHC